MKRHNPIINDKNAANSAIATVLMFAGVMSIISIMLVSIVPVINELQGAIEYSDADAQFEDLAEYQAKLAQRGLPGSSSEMKIDPLLGKLDWDLKNSGIWFSSTWDDNSELRLRNPGNFDDQFEIRYPNEKLTSYCMEDLHVQPESKWIYEIPVLQGKIVVAPKTKFTTGFTTPSFNLIQQGEVLNSKLESNQVIEINLPISDTTSKSKIVSDVELTIILLKGDSGITFIKPNNPNHNGLGTIWKIPLLEGENQINIISQKNSLISWKFEENKDIFEKSELVGDGSLWTKRFILDSPEIITIESSNLAKLLLELNPDSNNGTTNWASSEGLLIGNEFIIPPLNGSLIISNHEEKSSQIDVQGSAFSIAGNGMLKLEWPIAGTYGVTKISSQSDIEVKFSKNNYENNGFLSSGISYVVAKDTGSYSGQIFSTSWTGDYVEDGEAFLFSTLAGSKASLNYSGVFNATGELESTIGNSYYFSAQEEGELNLSVTSGQAVRLMQIIGTNGISELIEKGAKRCMPLDIIASGWINIDLPWYDVSELTFSGIRDAWENGIHHSGIKFQLIGETSQSSFSAFADAWIIQVPALKYVFSSSISNLEVVNKGGFVTTNHPEGKASLSHSALAAKGNENLLGVHLPITMPTSSSMITGSSNVNVELKVIENRFCTNEKTNSVRMGWNGAYGESIVNWLSEDLEYSEDWISFPNQYDLLSDYTGWINLNDGEAMYHSPNNEIDFTLTFTAISFNAMEEGG
ncbi:MAG: hypothetical protein CMB64_00945 [Euryarchaeota archaeon]|nr:hypothetical protein [Euryarchaeota archaeon]